MKSPFSGLVFLGLFVLGGCQTSLIQSMMTSVKNKPADPQSVLGNDDPLSRNAKKPAQNQNSLYAQIFGNQTPVESTDLLKRARQAEEQNRPDDAVRYYKQVLQKYPSDVFAHRRLAALADKRRDFRTSEYHYQLAAQHDPRNPDLLNDIGYSYLLQKRYKECERTLNAVLALKPTHTRALGNLGRLYVETGNYDGAQAVFRQGRSEREVQAMLARYFPNGRSNVNLASRNTSPQQNQTNNLQAPLPRGHFPPAMNLNDIREQQNTSSRPGPNAITQDIAHKMAMARQDSLTARRSQFPHSARSTNTQQPGRFQNSSYRTTSPVYPSTRNERSPADWNTRPELNLTGGVVPDHNLNRAFRQIDRRNYRQSAYPENRSLTNTDSWRQAPLAGNRTSNSNLQNGYDRQYSSRPAPRRTIPYSEATYTEIRQPIERARHTNSQYQTPNSRLPIWPDDSRQNRIEKRVPTEKQYQGSLNAVNQEALRLGHNAGLGVGMFPIPQSSPMQNNPDISTGLRHIERYNGSTRQEAIRREIPRGTIPGYLQKRMAVDRQTTETGRRQQYPQIGRDRMAVEQGGRHDFSTQTFAPQPGGNRGVSTNPQSGTGLYNGSR